MFFFFLSSTVLSLFLRVSPPFYRFSFFFFSLNNIPLRSNNWYVYVSGCFCCGCVLWFHASFRTLKNKYYISIVINRARAHTHTNKHTHIYLYTYIHTNIHMYESGEGGKVMTPLKQKSFFFYWLLFAFDLFFVWVRENSGSQYFWCNLQRAFFCSVDLSSSVFVIHLSHFSIISSCIKLFLSKRVHVLSQCTFLKH